MTSRRSAFTGTSAAAAQQRLEDATAGLGEVKPKVTVASVADGDPTDTATLHWTWPIGGGWSYTTKASLQKTSDGTDWQVAWKDSVVEPSLAAGESLDATTVAAKRGDILGPHGVGLVTERPVLRFGVDKHKVKGPAALESARRLASLLGLDVAPYVKLVKGAGSEQFVPAIVYRQADVPAGVMQRLHPDQGRRRDRRRAAARHHQGVRGPDPGHRRAGHGRDDQGPPRRLPGR